MPMPIDLYGFACWFDDVVADELHEFAHAFGRSVTDSISEADTARTTTDR
jgi:hypothetical protein